ncbi:MAG: PD40 domain-containing protein [Acidobacteria bacterium]|nr:PD40 domain-containing protein [Acidobacteriota bacterium]
MRRSLLLVLATLQAACSAEYENPFATPNATATPPAGASLVLTSDAHASTGGSPRDVYALELDGGRLSRLTACNREDSACDQIEASVAPDRKRMIVRRVSSDANGDRRLTEDDGVALLFVDLERSLEAALLAPSFRVAGLDWSPVDELIVYSAAGEGGVEDLFRADSNGANVGNLTLTPDVRERHPRIDPTGTIAVFERIDRTLKGQIWVFLSRSDQFAIDTGAPGPGLETLVGTPYVVGGDATPAFSPDGRFVVFRRLTSTGNAGQGTWDVMTVEADGDDPRVVASGPAFRSAPDWGPQGIVFEEVDSAGNATLVLVQPDGSGRRAIATGGGAGFRLSNPRWLR